MTDSDDRLDKFEAELAEAQAHEHRTNAAARHASEEQKALRDALARLTATAPTQFAADGTPKAKSEAARLAGELAKLEKPTVGWGERIKAAEDRVRSAQRSLRAFTNDNTEALLADLEPTARGAQTGAEAALRASSEALDHLFQVDRQVDRLVAATSGLEPQKEMPHRDDLAKLRRVIDHLLRGEGVAVGLPRSIYPEGRTPLRVRTESGWIDSHAAAVGEHIAAKRAERAQRQAA